MKRLLSFSAGLVAAAVLAHAASAQTTVTSVNVVGFQVSDSPSNSLAMYSMPFVPMDGDSSITNLFASELTGGNNAASGDNVQFWDASLQQYVLTYKSTLIGFDGWRYANLSVANEDLSIGRGFWLISKQNVDQTLNMSGEIVTDNTVTQQVLVGLNMLSYPYNAEIDITNTVLDTVVTEGLNLAAADNIIRWDIATQTYQTFYKSTLFPGSPAAPVWVNANDIFTPVALNLKQGEGFWLQRKAANGATTWVETKPYSL